ncbi:hypothetical protein [Streptomyces sp. NPDC047014]|uniref:hypothetical protein n=1 Tax=Streptomyces sp. NPDC047014 TaxID=3155736 RepID=UPI0034080289
MKKNDDSICQELLEEGLDDWVPVDLLVALAFEMSQESGESMRDITARVLSRLLHSGLMQVGELGETGFEAWPEENDAVVRRVIEALETVKWEPALGVCWLANTPEADRLVSEAGH